MLGLGHGINKSVIRKKYALDYIPGGVENNVLWLSYHQMTGRRNDECFRLRDLTTSDEWDIGRIDGYVEYNRVLSLLGGHTGKATKIYNNTLATGATDAIQTNVANMPLVAEGGSFHHDGFKFVAASSNFMPFIDYTGVQIANPPLSIYQNISVPSIFQGFIFARLGRIESMVYDTEYSLRLNAAARLRKTISFPGIYKGVFNWQGTGADQGKTIVNGNITSSTYNNTVLTDTVVCTIGGWTTSYFFNGNIKTIAISTDNLYNYYNILAARC